MRRLPAAILLALTLTGVACGTQPAEESTSPSTTAASGNKTADPTTPKESTTSTTKKPRAKIKAQPDCQTYAAFSIGYSAIALARPDQREAVIVKFQPLVERLKQQTPQFAGDIDAINFISSKTSGGGTLTPEDKAALSKAFEGLTTWNAATCIIPPGAS